MTDQKALAEFAKSKSADAFAVLVKRYIDLVYSTACRVARDGHLAEDATQAVFIVLARKTHSINPNYLAGWMVNTARLAARDAVRTRNRQQMRDVEAAHMRSEIQGGDEPTAEQISPLLDDALARLSEADRSAVVMRFLQGRTFLEVGQALGISEEAARKRVERSIEKLRRHLCKSGVAPSVGGLAIVLAAHQAKAAPVFLLAHVASAIAGSYTGTAASIAKGMVWTMNMAKAKIAVLILVVTGFAIVGGSMLSTPRKPLSTLGPPVVTVQPVPAVADDRISTNDRLLITVDDLVGRDVETKFRSRVDPQGRISLPLIGQVDAAGKSLSNARDLIAKAYRDDQIIINAKVRVEFDERGAAISIQSAPIQVGDHLVVRVFDLVGLGSTSTTLWVVDANGCINTQPISKNGEENPPELTHVRVQGLTEFEAANKLANAYMQAQVLANAEVTVERICAREAADFKPLDERHVPRHARQ